MPLMSRTKASMAQLGAYRTDIRNRTPESAADVERILRPFLVGVKALGERQTRSAAPPPDSMMAAHRKEWKNASPELNQLSRRAVRVLCGDPQTTDDRVFVRALKASGRLSQSRWLAERLLDAYDIGWTPERAKYLAPTILAAFGLHRRCS